MTNTKKIIHSSLGIAIALILSQQPTHADVTHDIARAMFIRNHTPGMDKALGFKEKIEIGDSVTALEFDFVLTDDTGKDFRLSELFTALSDDYGKQVVLVFYSGNNNEQSIKHLCNIRDGYAKLQAVNYNTDRSTTYGEDGLPVRGILFFGVSTDSPDANRAFKNKYKLPFALLSDPDKAVAKYYGAKRMIGPNKHIAVLINNDGYVVDILKNNNITADQIIQSFNRAHHER